MKIKCERLTKSHFRTKSKIGQKTSNKHFKFMYKFYADQPNQ